jgi:nucleolar protein 58
VTALNDEAAALTDGKVSSMLSNLLQELKDESKASCTLARQTGRKMLQANTALQWLSLTPSSPTPLRKSQASR